MNLNADLGEGAGEDEAVLACVDSANIACGVHAGSVSVAIATAWRCEALGVEVGAHPGYDDMQGFGRVERSLSVKDIEALVAFQVAALAAIAPNRVREAAWRALSPLPSRPRRRGRGGEDRQGA